MVAQIVREQPSTALPPVVTAEAIESFEDILSAVFFHYEKGRLKTESTYARSDRDWLELAEEVSFIVDVKNRRRITQRKTRTGILHVTETFDAFGRLLSIEDDTEQRMSFTYLPDNQVHISWYGSAGVLYSRTEQYSEDGLLLRAEESGEGFVEYDYDAFGRLQGQWSESGEIRHFTYDAWSQMLQSRTESMQDGLIESKEYTYSHDGRLLAQQSNGVDVESYQYDLLGRVVRRRGIFGNMEWRYSGVSPRLESLRMASGREIRYQYRDPRGLLTDIIADGLGVQGVVGPRIFHDRISYGALGLPIQAESLVGDQVQWTVTKSYDGLGRSVREQSEDLPSVDRRYGVGGQLRDYGFDGLDYNFYYLPDGRLSYIEHDRADTLFEYHYEGPGPASEVYYGNGLTEHRYFREGGKLSLQTFSGVQNGQHFSLSYGYRNDGLSESTSLKTPFFTNTLVLGLDASGRVTQEAIVPYWDKHASEGVKMGMLAMAQDIRTYDLDEHGNWLRSRSWYESPVEFHPNLAMRYTQVPLGATAYDADGRQTQAGEKHFAYDAFGRLAEVTHASGSRCTYRYDAFGRRNYESCNGQQAWFAYDGDNLAVERNYGHQGHYGDEGIMTTLHTGLSSPVLQMTLDGAERHQFIMQGKDGSVRAIFDQEAKLLQSYNYTAYGETSVQVSPGQTAITSNRFGFQGHVYDRATGLYAMRARYYAPEWGRFLSPDPLGPEGGMNPYAFVGNRPGDLWDPWGLAPHTNPASTDLKAIFDQTGSFFKNPRTPRSVELDSLIGEILQKHVIENPIIVHCDVCIHASEAYDPPPGPVELRNALGLPDGVDTTLLLNPPIIEAGVPSPRSLLLRAGSVAKSLKSRSLVGRSLGGTTKRARKGMQRIGKRADTLKPGPFAKESIPAHRGRPTAPEQRKINTLMKKHGCHTCGRKKSGTKKGNAVADHQPPQALGKPKRFFPHCIGCARSQGGQVLKEKLKRLKKLKRKK